MPVPSSITSQVFLVTVSLDANGTIQFGGAMPADHVLKVDFGFAFIIFQLQTEGASFPDNPILFTADPAPACFVVQTNSPQQVTVLDFNTNLDTDDSGLGGILNGFRITVIGANGVAHTSQDPTILNAEVPPSTGFYKGEGEDPHVKTGTALRAV